MWICDTHADTLFMHAIEGRPLEGMHASPERLKKGGVSIQTMALWSGPEGRAADYEDITRRTLAAAKLLEDAGIRQAFGPDEAEEGVTKYMLSIEGCEVFEKGLTAVAEWRERGVRMGALLWNNPNTLGYPALGEDKHGLTEYGVKVAKEMQRLGIAVDVSHLNEAGFYDLFQKTDKVPMASHSCVMKLSRHPRNLTDEQLKLMIENGGYIGVNFCRRFLNEASEASVSTVADHIDYICQMGGEKNVGIGSDFDGIERTPDGLEGADRLGNLFDELRKRGYREETIRGVAGENLIRYFDQV